MANALDGLTRDDVGRLLLRLSVGGMMLLHGASKVSHGISGMVEHFTEKGIPGFAAYAVYLGEVLAPVLLILGLGTRIAGVLIVVTMVVAIGVAHADDVFALNARSGAWAIELPMLYLVGGACIALLGAGRISISRGRGRFD